MILPVVPRSNSRGSGWDTIGPSHSLEFLVLSQALCQAAFGLSELGEDQVLQDRAAHTRNSLGPFLTRGFGPHVMTWFTFPNGVKTWQREWQQPLYLEPQESISAKQNYVRQTFKGWTQLLRMRWEGLDHRNHIDAWGSPNREDLTLCLHFLGVKNPNDTLQNKSMTTFYNFEVL